MKDEQGTMWEEADVACFKALLLNVWNGWGKQWKLSATIGGFQA